MKSSISIVSYVLACLMFACGSSPSGTTTSNSGERTSSTTSAGGVVGTSIGGANSTEGVSKGGSNLTDGGTGSSGAGAEHVYPPTYFQYHAKCINRDGSIEVDDSYVLTPSNDLAECTYLTVVFHAAGTSNMGISVSHTPTGQDDRYDIWLSVTDYTILPSASPVSIAHGVFSLTDDTVADGIFQINNATYSTDTNGKCDSSSIVQQLTITSDDGNYFAGHFSFTGYNGDVCEGGWQCNIEGIFLLTAQDFWDSGSGTCGGWSWRDLR